MTTTTIPFPKELPKLPVVKKPTTVAEKKAFVEEMKRAIAMAYEMQRQITDEKMNMSLDEKRAFFHNRFEILHRSHPGIFDAALCLGLSHPEVAEGIEVYSRFDDYDSIMAELELIKEKKTDELHRRIGNVNL